MPKTEEDFRIEVMVDSTIVAVAITEVASLHEVVIIKIIKAFFPRIPVAFLPNQIPISPNLTLTAPLAKYAIYQVIQPSIATIA
jgi:hypothetical protein